MRRLVIPLLALAIGGVAAVRPEAVFWPAWLSIESPVNPADPATRGALLLVHAMLRDGVPTVAELSGTAEGVVGGARRSVALHFDVTPRPGVFAVRRQWPSDGTWLLEISFHATTAIATLDRDGAVASVRVPTHIEGGWQVPRAVGAKEIDSTLAAASRP